MVIRHVLGIHTHAHHLARFRSIQIGVHCIFVDVENSIPLGRVYAPFVGGRRLYEPNFILSLAFNLECESRILLNAAPKFKKAS